MANGSEAMVTTAAIAECDACNRPKHGQHLAGDVVLIRRIAEEGRLLCIVSDGLGSGVKANVLAGLTASMAARYAAAGRDPAACAAVIRRTLPVCRVRGISYATLTIVDVGPDGSAQVVEYGNPGLVHLRGIRQLAVVPERVEAGEGPGRELRISNLQLAVGDRLVAASDGVTQAGMGSAGLPFGWGEDGLADFLTGVVAGADPSARHLAAGVVGRACALDGGEAHDDITCAVLAWRQPRRLLIVTGAPYDEARDAELSFAAVAFDGRKAVCGGTTAEITARELGERLDEDLGPLDPEVPPTARINGFDLVTEGMITLARCLEILRGRAPLPQRPNGASRLAELILDSDAITFRVGTRINQAHQDPSLPVELGIRRTLVRGLAETLRERHAKAVDIQFV